MHKLIKLMEKVLHVDVLLTREGETLERREHNGKLRKGRYVDKVKKSSFPQRNVDSCNGLKDEVITPKCVHQVKEILDKYRYGVKTRQL